jgi:hypothetical protein
MNPISAGKALYRMAGAADEVVPAIKSGASSAKKAISEMADDWGWKGAKPGEMSGTSFTNMLEASRRAQNASFSPGAMAKEDALLKKASKQLANSGLGTRGKLEIAGTMSDFSLLEKAGIPRKYTGKILKSVGGRLDVAIMNKYGVGIWNRSPLTNPEIRLSFASELSSAMRPLTPAQRDTFISLYPEWSGTIEELSNAARLL